ncbi:hypothetical protein Pmani_002571 [Petrolisthes manimaculis]|uniref:Uncharacterized protein n=1 Tax=Petrolisthes manimaculis TaxID=1843537 RepID=A0AAE1QK63_9EUCA|nr:hypothetical protein Pmani_002571 [Petrolisthes manimaculis]
MASVSEASHSKSNTGRDNKQVTEQRDKLQKEAVKILGDKQNIEQEVVEMNKKVLDEVMRNTWKLKDSENYNHVKLRRDLSREDRMVLKEKLEEANKMNNERSEEEKKIFYFRVVGLRIIKWYMKKQER